MCGIAGGLLIDEDCLERMLNTIIHRGPDEEGKYIDDFYSVGVRRLSIIGGDNGKQPLENNKFVLAFNGEIYNWKELKNRLSLGRKELIDSDSKLLLEYLSSSPHFDSLLLDIRGMFAFALYDKQNHNVHLVRDRSGIKPLYYHQKKDRVFFGSEIKAILSAGVQSGIDQETLADICILGYPLGEATLFQGVSQLRPGEHVIITSQGLVKKRYYDFREQCEKKDYDISSFQVIAKRLSELIIASVQEQVEKSYPIQIMLSGGVDSGTLLHVIDELYPKSCIKLFTFAERYDNPDLIQSRRIAEYYNLPIHVVSPKNERFFFEFFDRYLYHIEDFSDETLPSYCLSEHISKNGKVAYCGQGPDELFGGYQKHRNPQAYLEDIRSNLHAYVSLCGKGFRNYDLIAEFIERLSKCDGPSIITQFDVEQELANVQLWRDDRASMAHGLELRVPFLDERILGLSAHLTSEQLIDTNGTNKVVLREAARILGVPDFIANRPKYLGGKNLTQQNNDYLRRMLTKEYSDFNSHYYHPLFSQSSFIRDCESLYIGMIDRFERIFFRSN